MSSDHRAQAPLMKPTTSPISDFQPTFVNDDLISFDELYGAVYSRPLLSELVIPSKSLRTRLEIIFEKATDLENVHKVHSLKAYPVPSIWINGEIFYVSEKPKPVDLDGGSNPTWNAYEEFELDIDEVLQKKPDLLVTVESKSKFPCRGSRFVSEASVAIDVLLNHSGDAANWKPVTVGLKNKKGEQHGSITFKYKFGTTLEPKSADLLSLFAEDPLSQSANGNPMDQMCKNDSHSILKGAVAKGAAGGTASGIFEALGELLLDL